ncbi:MAG: GatB/YqeY domain-containing protein [Planctomycetota bacterium]
MSLEAELKERVKAAMKSGNTLERDVLRVVLGDLQTAASRSAQPLKEAEELAVVKRMVKSMDETLGTDGVADELKEKVSAERAVLVELLPKTLSVEQITAALEPVADAVRSAGNDGAAMGAAMKHLKGQGAVVDGKDVSAAVRALRA